MDSNTLIGCEYTIRIKAVKGEKTRSLMGDPSGSHNAGRTSPRSGQPDRTAHDPARHCWIQANPVFSNSEMSPGPACYTG